MIDAEPSELLGFEGGDPVLGMYDLKILADGLGTTTGAWFYGDEKPMFRGSSQDAGDEQAAEIGTALMRQYLAVQAATA
jgi:hypothetical protein